MTISPPQPRLDSGPEETVLLDWRRRRNRRRLLLRLGIPLLVLLLVAAGIWMVGFSSVLDVRSVSTTGVNALDRQQVRQAAAVPYGAPLARVDLTAVQHRVAALRQVESVTVGRRWPHTVQIDVVERTAVYAVPQTPTGFLLVDRFGVGYRTVADAPKSLPRAAIPPSQPQLLRPLATVAGALPPSLRRRIDLIQADSLDAVVLRLHDGRTVLWGSADRSALKSRVLIALLKVHGTHYDVSAPGNPAVR